MDDVLRMCIIQTIGNQIEQTRALVDLARALGAGAATSCGAGWGGSVWAIVKMHEAELFRERWIETYRLRYPDLPSTAFVSPPSAGARRLGAQPSARNREH